MKSPIPEAQTPATSMRPLNWRVPIVAFTAGFFMTVLMGNVAIALREADVITAYLRVGGLLGALAGVTAALRATGASAKARAAGGLVTMVGVGLVIGSALLGVNRFLDASPATVHSAKVVKKTHSKNGTYVSVPSWMDPSREVELKVARSHWKQLQPGDIVEARAHAGRLGWPWAESVP